MTGGPRVRLKALVIKDDANRFEDLEDVIKVGRALGQQAFRTRENVRVIRIFGPDPEIGYVVVVGIEKGVYEPSGVRGTRKVEGER